MALTAVQVKGAKPADKAYKLYDGGGLILLVQPTGAKYWRYRYSYAGKEKLLALGVYPDLSLADARGMHSEARKLLAKGADPSEAKRASKAAKLVLAANRSGLGNSDSAISGSLAQPRP